jgi:hypothetical protein
MEMTRIKLAPPRLEQALNYLKGFAANAARKGEQIYRCGSVVELEYRDLDDELAVLAVVIGTEEYEVDICPDDDGWEGLCSCPVAADCKHCYAAVRALINDGADAPSPPRSSIFPSPVKAAAKAPAKAAGKSRPTAAVPPPPKPSPPPPPPEPFVLLLEGKLQRPLTAQEKKLAKVIADAFIGYRKGPNIPEHQISALWGDRQSWSWHYHQVWTDPPENPWEAWLHLYHYIRERKFTPPEFLAKITPVEEVQALVAAAQWRRSVGQWQAHLQELQRAALEAQEAPMDLRVVFRADGAHLETLNRAKEWAPLKQGRFDNLARAYSEPRLTPEAISVWAAFRRANQRHPKLDYGDPLDQAALSALLQNPLLAPRVLTEAEVPFERDDAKLRWDAQPTAGEHDHYRIALVREDGLPLPRALVVLDGDPPLYVTAERSFTAPRIGRMPLGRLHGAAIPTPAMETSQGVALLDAAAIPLPPQLAKRVVRHRPKLVIELALVTPKYADDGEMLSVQLRADWGGALPREHFSLNGWERIATRGGSKAEGAEANGHITTFDRTPLAPAAEVIASLRVQWNYQVKRWTRKISRKFPEDFAEWLQTVPDSVELILDPLLASLRERPVSAMVRLDVEPAGVDWFDLTVALDLPEVEFTPEELDALLNAKGGWVRLGAKGWRRLALQLTGDEDVALADLGLSARDLTSGDKQRLHALQLSQASTSRLLPPDRLQELRGRVDELKARVSPDVPAEISAELRPYQVEGFHFLAYLSTNRFGGLLADDMGLGKTVQTLTWLTWLRAGTAKAGPSLVVCPKSVMDNWGAESARFASHLRVKMWTRGTQEPIVEAARAHDLLVVNYAQLRLLEPELTKIPWLAVILDEAQAIKNPDSQTSRAACALRAEHRVALSGTPIENRLLDLWSIMNFTMPGVLGPRTRFARTYDQKDDPLARRRLAARTRPFVLRRTKEQVARDLPERIEEELLCEMEGRQATLYRAELKRARQELLKLKTAKELDGARFNILTSLLRLRQICCHPGLVDVNAMDEPSAKVEALLDLLEPLIEEGRKVLVFSQFVGVLEILKEAIEKREWRHFMLTGQTENRGDLIATFQEAEGSAVFLLSLKASGFGLNLTAASYVVLFDPWWNPAVENQAIDRTHRIGQKSTVFAYRLLVKGSIEEKIRVLQKQKRALAEDILGEESFARALTLDDLKHLLSE